MTLHWLDIVIIIVYLLGTLGFGFYMSAKATKDMNSYFLGGNSIKWYMLGLSNASGMWDISGTMWTVMILFVYGLKSAWIPWLWPVWNQVFVFVFLAIWMRRSNTMTGAQWITFRFGDGRGKALAYHHCDICHRQRARIHGLLFEGIGKFCTSILPYDLSVPALHLSNEHAYALIVVGITTIYTLKGGMYSVVATEILQFVIMTLSCLVIGYIAYTSVTAEQIAAATPAGWDNMWFGMNLGLDWTNTPYPAVNGKISDDGFGLFGALFMMMLFKGIFASLAGPVPSYDMQRILSTRTPAEAAKMSASTILVMYIPRYIMVAGFAVLGLVYLQPEIAGMGKQIDFEKVLPLAINKFVPFGWKGLLLAGLLAAFMGTFAAFVNAAPAYIVNDIYKKYINPNAPEKETHQAEHPCLICFGGDRCGLWVQCFITEYPNTMDHLCPLWRLCLRQYAEVDLVAVQWLWILRWHARRPYRFNHPLFFKQPILDALNIAGPVPDIYFFPAIFLISLLGCLLGTYLTPHENFEQVKTFYKETRPWGFWKPVREAVIKEDPSFQPNKDLGRDAFNVITGMVWQMSQVVIPIYFMIRNNTSLAIWTMIFFVTSWLLKNIGGTNYNLQAC